MFSLCAGGKTMEPSMHTDGILPREGQLAIRHVARRGMQAILVLAPR